MPQVDIHQCHRIPNHVLCLVAVVHAKSHEVSDLQTRAPFCVEYEVLHCLIKEVTFDLLEVEAILLRISTDRINVKQIIREQVIGAAFSINPKKLQLAVVEHEPNSVDQLFRNVGDNVLPIVQIRGLEVAS